MKGFFVKQKKLKYYFDLIVYFFNYYEIQRNIANQIFFSYFNKKISENQIKRYKTYSLKNKTINFFLKKEKPFFLLKKYHNNYCFPSFLPLSIKKKKFLLNVLKSRKIKNKKLLKKIILPIKIFRFFFFFFIKVFFKKIN
jgi:hypothetical protein